MNKIKIGIVEVLGLIGILLWSGTVIIRGFHLSNNELYLLILGSLPNLAAAWAVTLFAKWYVLFVLKKDITVKSYAIICFGIVLIALTSEVIHAAFFDSPFDINDMVVTIIAQVVLFLIPLITKDKYFSNYIN